MDDAARRVFKDIFHPGREVRYEGRMYVIITDVANSFMVVEKGKKCPAPVYILPYEGCTVEMTKDEQKRYNKAKEDLKKLKKNNLDENTLS